jgi:hypothetical protein
MIIHFCRINEKKGQLQLLKKDREKLLDSFNDNNKFLLEKQELVCLFFF